MSLRRSSDMPMSFLCAARPASTASFTVAIKAIRHCLALRAFGGSQFFHHFLNQVRQLLPELVSIAIPPCLHIAGNDYLPAERLETRVRSAATRSLCRAPQLSAMISALSPCWTASYASARSTPPVSAARVASGHLRSQSGECS